jgi:WD40 repeat protein
VWNVDALAAAETIANASRLPLTGVAWSTAMPWLLATCSADAVVNLFDVRALSGSSSSSSSSSSSGGGSAAVASGPQRPAVALTAPGLDGASVLAWNRRNGWELATAHGRQLWLWDIRGGTGGSSGDAAGAAALPPPSSLGRSASLGVARRGAERGPALPAPGADAWRQWDASAPRPQWSSPETRAAGPEATAYGGLASWSSRGSSPSSGSGSGSGGYARRALTVHMQRILDLDWSYHDENVLATCALDKVT